MNSLGESAIAWLANPRANAAGIQPKYFTSPRTELLLSQYCGCQLAELYNEERPNQSLGYQTPAAVYASGMGGGAMIVDKFGGAREESPAQRSGAGDSSRAQPGQRCSAACEEMDAA